MNWVLISKFIELTGYSEVAVRAKMYQGVWQKDLHWRKAGGRIHISMTEYDTWVVTQGKITAASPTPGMEA
jgi:hypothetical protein